MLLAQNSSWPNGGRSSQLTESTTLPLATFTSPTEHAEAGDPFAVSKSIAVKFRGTAQV